MSEYLSGKQASVILGISQNTLRKYANLKKINTILTPGGQRRYDVNSYLKRSFKKKRLKICYCRVSSQGQKDDLVRQVNMMSQKYPNHIIISDVGSGINFKRPGLRKIINYAILGRLEELVVAHKDRLCRIGYDLIEYILLNYSNTQIITDIQSIESDSERITKDLLEIITVYGAKLNGKRKYKKV